MSSGPGGPSGEQLRPAEPIAPNLESASRLTRASDALFDGKKLQLGFTDLNTDGTPATPEQKQQRMQQVVDVLNKPVVSVRNENGQLVVHRANGTAVQIGGLNYVDTIIRNPDILRDKFPESYRQDIVDQINTLRGNNYQNVEVPGITGRTMTADDVTGLEARVSQALGHMDSDVLNFYVTSLGTRLPPEVNAATIAMVADYIAQHPTARTHDIITQVARKAEQLATAYSYDAKQHTNSSIGILGKDGSLATAVSDETTTAIVRKDGTVDAIAPSRREGDMVIHHRIGPVNRLQTGDKVVFASRDAISAITANKNLQSIVGDATQGENPKSIVAVELTEKEVEAPVAAAVDVLSPTDLVDDSGRAGSLLRRLAEGAKGAAGKAGEAAQKAGETAVTGVKSYGEQVKTGYDEALERQRKRKEARAAAGEPATGAEETPATTPPAPPEPTAPAVKPTIPTPEPAVPADEETVAPPAAGGIRGAFRRLVEAAKSNQAINDAVQNVREMNNPGGVAPATVEPASPVSGQDNGTGEGLSVERKVNAQRTAELEQVKKALAEGLLSREQGPKALDEVAAILKATTDSPLETDRRAFERARLQITQTLLDMVTNPDLNGNNRLRMAELIRDHANFADAVQSVLARDTSGMSEKWNAFSDRAFAEQSKNTLLQFLRTFADDDATLPAVMGMVRNSPRIKDERTNEEKSSLKEAIRTLATMELTKTETGEFVGPTTTRPQQKANAERLMNRIINAEVGQQEAAKKAAEATKSAEPSQPAEAPEEFVETQQGDGWVEQPEQPPVPDTFGTGPIDSFTPPAAEPPPHIPPADEAAAEVVTPEPTSPPTVEAKKGTPPDAAARTRESDRIKETGEGHTMPYILDVPGGMAENSEQFKADPENSQAYDRAKQMIEDAKKLIPQGGMSEAEYRLHIIDQLEDRIRWTGDYDNKSDTLHNFVNERLHGDDVLTLKGMVANRIDILKAQQVESKARKRRYEPWRRAVKTEVAYEGPFRYVEGVYDSYFAKDEAGKLVEKRAPKSDLVAFTLVADRLMDVQDPVTNKTYRDLMKEQDDIIRNTLKLRGEAVTDGSGFPNELTAEQQQLVDAAAQRLTSIRGTFYSYAFQAFESRSMDRYINTTNATNDPRDKAVGQMQQRLREVAGLSIEQLTETYKGMNGEGFDVQKKGEIQELLRNRQGSLMDFAMKGCDLMRRRISYIREISIDVVDRVPAMRKVQGPTSSGTQPQPATPQPPQQRTPPPAKPPARQNDQPPTETPSRVTDKTGDEGTQPETPGEAPSVLPPAPDGNGKEQEDAKPPEGLNPAPGQEDDKPRPPKPAPQPGPQPKPEEPLETEMNLAMVALQNRRAENTLQTMEHSFAHDLRTMPIPGYARIPIIGNVLWGIRHPIKLIWQNGVARSVFEQQHLRFTSDIQNIVKNRVADTTIPIEVSNDLVSKALVEGRNMRNNQRFLSRVWWGAKDFAQGITGIAQSSEQIFAKRWLEQELAKPADQWSAELRVNPAKVLQEQSALGNRFAHVPEGLTLDQANRFLAQGVGETRHQLDAPKEIRDSINTRLKGFLEQYANGTMTQEQLVAAVNNYFLTDFVNTVPANLREEISASEAASNILQIAEKVKNNWNRYQSEKGESGKSKWEELQLNILYGRGEWGGVRGRKEMGIFGFTERMARRMANRNAARGTGYVTGAWSAIKDVATFGGAYAGGWVVSGAMFGTSMFARTAGAAVGAGAMAALKETGLRIGGIGWTGRYGREAQQLDREVARGRISPADARIRQELQPSVVDKKSATVLAGAIETLREKDALTDTEVRQLLRALAEAKARMKISDLSSTRALNNKVHNLISFTEGKENDQYDALTAAVLNGVVRLQTALSGNPTLLNNLLTEVSGGGPQNTGAADSLNLLDRYTALVGAQLRESSNAVAMRRLLLRQGYNAGEADDLINNIYPGFNMNITEENSIRGKDRTLRNLTWRRGFSKFVGTTAGAGLVPLVGAPIAVAGYAVVDEVRDLAGEGWRQYTADWSRIAGGDVPVRLDASGRPAVDLTFTQRAVLAARSFVEPPHWPIEDIPRHHEQIDVVDVNLGPDLRHGEIGGRDYLVDIKSARLVDLGDHTFTSADTDGDGNADLALKDATGRIIALNDPSSPLSDFSERQGNPIIEQGEILKDTDRHVDSSVVVGGKTFTMKVPEGTEWTKDGNRWDLVVKDGPGKGYLLVDNAEIDGNGKIVRQDFLHSAIEMKSEGGGAEVRGPAALAEWKKYGHEIAGRQWYANDTTGSDGNELNLYTHKNGTELTLDMSKMGMAKQTGLVPNPINVQEVINRNEATFSFSIPGLGKEPVIVQAPGGQLKLDIADNDPSHAVTIIKGGSTQQVQAGEFARMVINEQEFAKAPNGDIATELTGRQAVFNIGAGQDNGYISAGRLTENNVLQSFATITGKGELAVGGGEGSIRIDLKGPVSDGIPRDTFNLDGPPLKLNIPDIPVIPVPMRQNIERSVSQGSEEEKALNEISQKKGRHDPHKQNGPKKPLTPEQQKQKAELEKKIKELGAVAHPTEKQKKDLEKAKKDLQDLESSVEEEEDEKRKDEKAKEGKNERTKEQESGEAEFKVEEDEPDEKKKARFKAYKERKLKEYEKDLAELSDEKFQEKNGVTKEDFRKTIDQRATQAFINEERNSLIEKQKIGIMEKTVKDVLSTYSENHQQAFQKMRDALNNKGDEINAKVKKRYEAEKVGRAESELDELLKKINKEVTCEVSGVTPEDHDVAYTISNNISMKYSAAIRELGGQIEATLKPKVEKWNAELFSGTPEEQPKRGEGEAESSVTIQTQEKLNKEIVGLKEAFRNEKDVYTHSFPTAGKYYWQGVQYGPKREVDSDTAYRGYLMIETEDIPKALALLKKIAHERASQNKTTDFKWLMMTLPKGIKDKAEALKYIGDNNNYTKYSGLEATDPRIALYGNTAEEVRELIERIAEEKEWEEIEQNRINKSGGKPENARRRPGTNTLQYKGKEFRSINYNDKPGYSEDEAADPNWRDRKISEHSVPVTT